MKLLQVTYYLTIAFLSQSWGKIFLVKTADTNKSDEYEYESGNDYQDNQEQPCSENCIEYLIKCNLLYADEDFNRKGPCNKEDKATRGWKKSTCTKLERGIIDLQKFANLWATGEMDVETRNLINSNTCPVNPAFECSCNGDIDKKGQGECKTSFEGEAWCYVVSNSACADTQPLRGSWWSFDACKGKNVIQIDDAPYLPNEDDQDIPENS